MKSDHRLQFPRSLACLSRSCCCCLVAKSSLTLCDLMEHTRLPCPSLSPGVCSNSCPLSQWCYLTISSSVVPFSPSTFPSIKVFSNESALHIRCPKYWSITFSISPSSEYSDSYISALLSFPTRLKAPWRQKQCFLNPSALLPPPLSASLQE